MKETTMRAKERILDLAKNYSLKLLLFKMVCFIAGVMVSKGSIFGGYHPFGLSFSGAATGRFFVPITIGAVFGYLFPLRMAAGVRYIASLVAIAAVRWTLSDLKKVKESSFYIPILVFVSSLITGIAVNCAGNFESSIIIVSVVESGIAALAAYFFDRSYKILVRVRSDHELSYKDLVYISISLSLILFSLEDINFGSVSLGRILAMSVILLASYLIGTVGGAIFGIAMSVVFGLSTVGFTYLSGVYAFGGMIGGMCSGMGRVAISGIILLIEVLFSIQSGNTVKMVSGLYECVFAISIFLVVPKKLLNGIRNRILFESGTHRKNNFGEAIVQKLNFMSKFLVGVSKLAENFDRKQNCRSSLKNDYEASISKTCCACNQRGYCYGCYKNDTAENLKNAIESALNGEFRKEDVFSKSFAIRCTEKDRILNNLSDIYKLQLTKESADSKISYIKNAAGQQLCAVSSLLDNISDEICKGEGCIDKTLASKIINDLANEKIDVTNIICRRDSSQNLFIEMELLNRFRNAVDKRFFDVISKSCRKELGKPVVMGLGKSFRVQVCEKTKYRADYFVAQHNCNNGKVCGDSFRAFESGDGIFHIILSDGMGTGISAAKEGELTSEMMKNFMKAGMGFECSVKLVNSSLIMNTREETLSTLDVMSLNLFNGVAKFMKAGAPFTYVLRDNELVKIDTSSLPIGIFTDVTVAIKECKLRENDYVIILSDGVTDIGEEWIEEILKNKKFSTSKGLANEIVETAVHMRKSTHDDDITAIVIKVIKNE